MDATAYLLERSGDILGAFKLIREVSGRQLAFHETCVLIQTGLPVVLIAISVYSLCCQTSTYHCPLHATFGVDECPCSLACDGIPSPPLSRMSLLPFSLSPSPSLAYTYVHIHVHTV